LLWEKRYDGPIDKRDLAQAMVMDAGGNVVVTGRSGVDYYTAKYAAADGALLWEKRGPTIYNDQPLSVAVDGNGNVVVTGNSLDVDSINGTDFYTAKYAALTGALLWEKRYNGPANSEDFAQAVAVDGSGNVLVTGTSGFSDGFGGLCFADFYTAKYAAANGALLWEKSYNSPANSEDVAAALAVDSGGNVVVTGQSGSDCYTAKYAAATGTLLWDKQSTNGFGKAVAVDTIGNFVVTGNSATLMYAAATGVLLWEKPIINGAGRAVAVDTKGNAVVAGHSGGDCFTSKYAGADGALLWTKTYNGPANGDDVIGGSHGLALGRNGMVAIAGASDGNFGPGVTYDYMTVVYRETHASPTGLPAFVSPVRLQPRMPILTPTACQMQWSSFSTATRWFPPSPQAQA
jgi:hypothetical protein